jgi:hypothetical protein
VLSHSGPGDVCSGAVERADSGEAENDAIGSAVATTDEGEPTNDQSIAPLPEGRKPERLSTFTPVPFALLTTQAVHVPNHPQDPAPRLAAIVEDYRHHDNLGALFDALRALARETSPEDLIAISRPFRDVPEVVIPLFESITERSPDDAQSKVVLANAYWLTGRGPETVGRLAERARELDAENRGAWHLYALSESDPRARMDRWREVTLKFPSDQLARAALADNAASVAGAEHDPLALDLAVATYESLLREAKDSEQKRALKETIATLKKWRI